MSNYPPLPDRPACWSWEIPPLPQENSTSAVSRWQQDRCAICAHHMPEADPWGKRRNGLVEDHCHSTGRVRGSLCPRCNTTEGRSSLAVFEMYRRRHPTLMLGVDCRRGRYGDSDRDQAKRELWRAVDAAWYRTHPDGYAKDRHYADLNQAAGRVDWPDPLLPEWTPLMRAVHRVGLTPAELELIAEKHRAAAMGIVWRPYDEWRDNPMRRRPVAS